MLETIALDEPVDPSASRSWARKLSLFRRRLNEGLRVLSLTDRTVPQKINYLRYKMAHYRKLARVPHYPIKLTIDPCNACNLRCALCPTGLRDTGRHITKMKYETFEQLMNECGKYLWEIDFFNWGEPLLNKEIYRMIEYAKTLNITTSVSSNLNFCTEQDAEKLVRSGLDKLIVSLDGASQESIEKYQVGNKFDLVLEHLRRVIHRKREVGSKTPFVQWRFLVNRYNEHEIDKAQEMADTIGVDYLEIARFRCSMHDELHMNSVQQFGNVQDWLPEDQNLSMYQYDAQRRTQLLTSCVRPWYESVIHPDGSVSPCCGVWYEEFDFGNIRDASFRTIWNGEKYQQARTLFHRPGSEFPGHICDTCVKNNAIF